MSNHPVQVTPAPIALTAKQRSAVAEALAEAGVGKFESIDAALLSIGVDPESSEALLADPAMQREVEGRRALLLREGEGAAAKALELLGTTLSRIAEALESEANLGTLTRTLEALHRITGVAERRAAALKREDPSERAAKPRALVHIIYNDDDERRSNQELAAAYASGDDFSAVRIFLNGSQRAKDSARAAIDVQAVEKPEGEQ